MAKFHLEIDEFDRALLMYALGAVHQIPQSSLLAQRVAVLSPVSPDATAAKPSSPVGMPAAVETSRAPARSASPPEPPASETKSKKPETKSEALTITPLKVEQAGDSKSMLVHYLRPGTTRQAKIRCWDPTLFSSLLATVQVPTTFLVRQSNGYTNIVGVKR